MKYVALLRGINVGGKNMIKMETLRAMLGALGFENVQSYINSGNVVFETAAVGQVALEQTIHDAIRVQFGFEISVMIRSIEKIRSLVDANPFEGRFENDKDLHVFFLREPLSDEQTSLLLANESDDELFSVRGREIFNLLRISILDSVMGKGFIDKKLKIPATARNWRTVKKLAEM